MKSILKSVFNSLGLEITRKKPAHPDLIFYRNQQMIEGLRRCNAVLPNITTIIDIGAAAGSWSLSSFELWAQSNYLMFEPLDERKEELETLQNRFPNFHFVHAAAGKEKGEVTFYVSGDLDGSGVAREDSIDPNLRKVKLKSIDQEVNRLELKGPYLIKLDTHGFEVPIIEGCQQIMNQVSCFVIECYGFYIAEKSLLFWEMCKYMDELGFRLFDIVDVMNRPKDGAFWQCDAFFLRKENPVWNNIQYS